MGFVIVLSVIIYVIISALCASLMRNAAIQKGYGDDIHAWAVCFWLGIFGYLYIIALPDKIAQSQNQQIIETLRKGE
ncbi:MAG: hypothetical protein Q4B40_05400 [Clostridia bacterium]|nr:hypothetical protein [Clostridia bacterium]